MDETIGAFFSERASRFAVHPFLEVPADPGRNYHPDGYRISFGDAAQTVEAWAGQMKAAGYGPGHRVAALMANRPEMLLLKLALARAGVSWVPVNPDYRPAEIAYLLQDSSAILAVAAPGFLDQMRAGIAASGRALPLLEMGETLPMLPQVEPGGGNVAPESEASLIYTSGTTGRPKGCIMSHDYEVQMGKWYGSRGGVMQFGAGKSRIYCPLPLFHVNAAILLLLGVIETGSAQILPERFRASAWWREIAETRATAAHYLGIVIPALMNRAPEPSETEHLLEFAVGAGVEPTLHAAFESRFGFPLVEVWGMTEMCRILADCTEPRRVGTRAMGRQVPGLEVRVLDENDVEVPRGTEGEMVIRYDANTPRKGAFSGYLNLPEETEKAWRGGWFHTGDTVVMDESDMLYFVDRKKNIIRRSGENIAAAEVEACLQEHAAVERVAVIAVPDAMRDEEVMACVQLAADVTPEALFEWCFERLAYYKAPGWVRIVKEVPVTGTQKIQKHALFGAGEDPLDGAVDFRDLKRRG